MKAILIEVRFMHETTTEKKYVTHRTLFDGLCTPKEDVISLVHHLLSFTGEKIAEDLEGGLKWP